MSPSRLETTCYQTSRRLAVSRRAAEMGQNDLLSNALKNGRK